MTMPWRPGQVQRRCSCCGELRWPPVCYQCDALLPPVALVDRLDPEGQTMVRDGEDYQADQIAAVNRQQFGSTPTDTTRE